MEEIPSPANSTYLYPKLYGITSFFAFFFFHKTNKVISTQTSSLVSVVLCFPICSSSRIFRHTAGLNSPKNRPGNCGVPAGAGSVRGQRGIYLHHAMGHVLVPSGTLLSWCPPWGVGSMPSLPSKSAQFVAQISISRFPLQGFAGVQRAQGRSFPINSSSGSFVPARGWGLRWRWQHCPRNCSCVL